MHSYIITWVKRWRRSNFYLTIYTISQSSCKCTLCMALNKHTSFYKLLPKYLSRRKQQSGYKIAYTIDSLDRIYGWFYPVGIIVSHNLCSECFNFNWRGILINIIQINRELCHFTSNGIIQTRSIDNAVRSVTITYSR